MDLSPQARADQGWMGKTTTENTTIDWSRVFGSAVLDIGPRRLAPAAAAQDG